MCDLLSRVKYVTHQTGISCLSTRRPGTYHETTNSPTANHSSLYAEDINSPRTRRGSGRQVKFGPYDDSVILPPSIVVGRMDDTDCRLDVVAEEPSWEIEEHSSGAPLCCNTVD